MLTKQNKSSGKCIEIWISIWLECDYHMDLHEPQEISMSLRGRPQARHGPLPRASTSPHMFPQVPACAHGLPRASFSRAANGLIVCCNIRFIFSSFLCFYNKHLNRAEYSDHTIVKESLPKCARVNLFACDHAGRHAGFLLMHKLYELGVGMPTRGGP